jgi:hypothetical protein
VTGPVPSSGQPTFPSHIEAERADRAAGLPDGWPQAFTDNGVRIVPGLRVRDYNWRETTVTDERPHMGNAPGGGTIPWFTTANGGMFDGSRLFAL